MKYMGSKAKYAQDICKAIADELNLSVNINGLLVGGFKYKNWVEPFVGGANMIEWVTGFENKIGNDINPYLIEMFRAVQKGWKPSDRYDELTYKLAKENAKLTWKTASPDLMIAEIGFIGIGCSYSGKWFGGYARGNDNKGNPRNYAKESKDNLMEQKYHIQDVQFTVGDYIGLRLPSIAEYTIVYCDPPYRGTTQFKNKFDSDKFWSWCDEISSLGYKVFVSEYNAPEGWRCIWQKEVNNSLTKNTGAKKGIEKLFTK